MSTRMSEPQTEMRGDQDQRRGNIWPWVLLAIALVALLWWSSANQSRNTGVNRAPEPTMNTPTGMPGSNGYNTGGGATPESMPSGPANGRP